ncbi:phage tail tape measure protein [Citreicella sp. C3M06]|uniref:phage tail tape measure protein n=1 Tax=Citreicella sp. C3M06 TaxID=2841564 RepID=UPI001C086F66|nr:phage tail tape measure protein [Citreicella sp. C3M06]MBU2961964.1 phage tail tape measure protein [Citreicella sp. C3M06]
MSRSTRDYKIRLSASGKQQLEADLRALGASGEKSLKRIQTATRPASAGLRETDLAARQLRGGLAAVSAELPALGRLATFMGGAALVGGLAAFGRGSLDAGRQFQAMMQRVEAATQASQDDLDRLGGAAKRLGETTAFSAMQAAEAIEVLAKNGVSVSAILGGALDSSVMLASALGSEVAPAADLVTDVMQQFGLTADRLPDIVDRLAGAAFTSKFGFDDLRLAIAQAGGVAGSTGVEIEDFLTTLSATAASFASGSDAGTSYKTFLQRLVPESAKAAGVMKRLGLEFFDANGNMKDMASIAQELQDGLAGLDDASKLDALKTVFGTDAIRTAASLAEQGAAGFRDLASAIGEVSAQEQAEVRLRGLDGALKELAAAWEALQLEAAQSGGLEVAEKFTRRLTEALRYLTENFAEVEEIAERVGQALTVYLALKGMGLVIAKGVAMRAAMIELATSVAVTGTAAGRAVGPLTRLGVAARVLTGIMGGPLSLAITAASLVAFGIDTDVAADAVGRADTAATKAADALDAYQEASKRAAEEQKGLGGAVSEATQAMLTQSRAALAQSIEDAERELRRAQKSMSGAFFDGDGFDDFAARYRILFRTNLQTGLPEGPRNRFLTDLAEMADQASRMEVSGQEFWAAFTKVQGVGSGVEEIRNGLEEILAATGELSDSDALKGVRDVAAATGLFAEQINEIDMAEGEAEIRSAYGSLLEVMDEAIIAGRQLRQEQLEGFRANAEGLAAAEKDVVGLREREKELLETSRDIAAERPFDETADSAKDAANEIDRLKRTYEQYQQGRSGSDSRAFGVGATAAAKSGLRDLIGYAEGTDKGRKYNETLDYGRWTGGDVNLVAMSLNDVLALQDQMRTPENRAMYGDGAGSSAVGRYQIVSSTLRSLMDEMGLTGSELFSPGLQDQMADRLIDRRGRDPSSLRQEWQGLNRVDDASILGAFDQGVGDRARASAERDQQAAAAAEERASTLRDLIAVGEQQLDQLRFEAALTGQSVEDIARLTFQRDALNRAKQAGLDLDQVVTSDGQTLRQTIDEQAAAWGRLAAAQEEASRSGESAQATQQALDEELQQYKQSVSSLMDNLKPGNGGIEAFWEDLRSRVIDTLWSMATDPVWDMIAEQLQGLVSGVDGSGGFLSTLISGVFGGGTSGDASVDVPKRAAGGGFDDVGRATGLLDGHGGKRQDNLLALVSRGEFMQPASAVDFYGESFMEDIRNRRIPKFSDGGSIGGASSGAASEGRGQGGLQLSGGDLTLTDDGRIMARVRVEQAQSAAGIARATSRNFTKRAAQQRERGV